MMYRFSDDLPVIDQPRSSLLSRALDPADAGVAVIAWPGRHIAAPLKAGDIIVRQPLAGPVRSFVLTREVSANGEAEVEAIDMNAVMIGNPPGVLIRLHGPDRMLRDDLTIVRAVAAQVEANYGETPPLPPQTTSRPTIRQGSRGPAVNEAQQRMNAIDARRLARGESRIVRCPLVVDGIFGPNTRGATVSFQRLAFPGQPNEWDGIIGPKTWAMLDAWSYEQPVDPPIQPPIGPPVFPPIGPVIPVVHTELDPPRWGPILSASMSSSAKLRTGNFVSSLIDGRETFDFMAKDIGLTDGREGKQDYIYLLGWDMVDDFDMLPDPLSSSLYPNACPASGPQTTGKWSIKSLLTKASGRNVQVRVILWAFPGGGGISQVKWINGLKNGAAIRDDDTANNGRDMKARLWKALAAAGIAPALIPVIISMVDLNDIKRFVGSHHQKVLIVKRGDRLIAYCGGVDINSNRLYVVKGKGGDPQHDAHCRIIGPSAWDLLQTFIQRWHHHPNGAKIDANPDKGPLRGASEAVPAKLNRIPTEELEGVNRSGFSTTPQNVIIARTFNPVNKVAGVVAQQDIRSLILASIRNANRFIYLEDQYLIDREVAAELNVAVRRRLKHLTILICPTESTGVPWQAEFRRDFVDDVLKGLGSSDRAKVGFFQRSAKQSELQIGCHTYVHAKTWVFDDELAVIGSANCNRRGYQHDSEVDAFIFDSTAPGARTAASGGLAFAGADPSEFTPIAFSFAQFYRMRLWREHLGISIRDPRLFNADDSFALWRAGGRPGTAKIIDFDHRITGGKFQPLREQAKEAVRSLVDPVP